MGGVIEFTSEKGRGTTFYFVLDVPVKKQRLSLETMPSSETNFEDGSSSSKMTSPYDMKILVVDDNKINQLLLKRMLTKMQIPCTTADDGFAAIQEIANQVYHCIFMDVQMPGK